MGLLRQEYWSGLPFPSLGIVPTQELNPHLLHCSWILYCWATGELPYRVLIQPCYLKLCSKDQQHWHHLGAYCEHRISDFTPELLIPIGMHNKFEKHCWDFERIKLADWVTDRRNRLLYNFPLMTVTLASSNVCQTNCLLVTVIDYYCY